MKDRKVMGQETTSKTFKTSRDINLDLLRIMACMAVVGLHTLNKDASLANSFMYYLCGFAVPVFFMISGYLLMNRTPADQGGYSYEYIEHKILNIIRLIVIWNVVYWLYNVITEILKDSVDINDFYKLPKCIVGSLIQKGLCWQFWYFGAVILIYMMLPVLFKMSEKGRRILLTVVVCICIGFQIISMTVGWPVQSTVIQTFRLWTWGAYFMLGSFMPVVQRKIEKCLTFKTHGLYLMMVTILVGVYQSFMGSNLILYQDISLGVTNAEYFYDSVLTFLWVVLLFTFIKRVSISEKTAMRIEKISGLTLGVYCGHPLLVRILSHFILVDSLLSGLLFWLMIIGVTTGIICALKEFPFGRYFILM